MSEHRRTDADIFGDDWKPKRGPGRPIADHRQRKVLAEAERVELQNAKLRGELLDAAKVEATWTAAVLDVRASILAVPSRFGARHGLSQAILTDLDADLRDALTSLAGDRDASDG